MPLSLTTNIPNVIHYCLTASQIQFALFPGSSTAYRGEGNLPPSQSPPSADQTQPASAICRPRKSSSSFHLMSRMFRSTCNRPHPFSAFMSWQNNLGPRLHRRENGTRERKTKAEEQRRRLKNNHHSDRIPNPPTAQSCQNARADAHYRKIPRATQPCSAPAASPGQQRRCP